MAPFIPLFKSKLLKPEWKFSGDGIIWRLFFARSNRIVGEIRNQENKSTSFFCVDAVTGKPLWKNVRLDESWWIGIEAVFDKWIILHGYTRPDMPEHKGIWVLDLETGKLLWQNNSFTFWFQKECNLYAYQYLFDKRIGYELDINDGSVIAEYSENLDALAEKLKLTNADIQQEIVFPALAEKIEQVPFLEEFDICRTDDVLDGWIEYFNRENMLVLSYYQKSGVNRQNKFDNILVIYNINLKKQVYKDYIAKDINTPSADTFFVKDDLALFIQEQRTLTAIKPWK